jgi:hypothetical protein
VEEPADNRDKNDIKKAGAKKDGGIFSCCGPRQDEEESDSDEGKGEEEVSSDEGPVEKKGKQQENNNFAREVYSEEQIKQMTEFQNRHGGGDGGQDNQENKEGGCHIF